MTNMSTMLSCTIYNPSKHIGQAKCSKIYVNIGHKHCCKQLLPLQTYRLFHNPKPNRFTCKYKDCGTHCMIQCHHEKTLYTFNQREEAIKTDGNWQTYVIRRFAISVHFDCSSPESIIRAAKLNMYITSVPYSRPDRLTRNITADRARILGKLVH